MNPGNWQSRAPRNTGRNIVDLRPAEIEAFFVILLFSVTDYVDDTVGQFVGLIIVRRRAAAISVVFLVRSS